MRETLYTIGEVSKLANISIKALRYYDKINLFKPSYVDPGTNYRYYKDSQLYRLDLIKSLKYIGTPLEEMKKAQELKTDELFTFLTEQEKIVREKVDYLLEIEQNIANVKKRMQRQKNYPVLGEVFVLEEEEMRIIQVEADGISQKEFLNAFYSKLKHTIESIDGFLNNGEGAIFSYQPYVQAEEIRYMKLFMPVLTAKQELSLPQNVEISSIPGGKYVCIAFIYSPESYFKSLKKLISHIEEHHFTVISDIYEVFSPSHYSPNQSEEYIVEMKIKVSE
ncbi:MerR family transcriptional regulator [Bacillus sp. MUM 13]|uniref:MerR family transcriptional regulator n=1 Tax=Bacillus sp. MUM 13 TaxID=1678001 RepID=UPI0008F58125|nr:MerR family transcriptional regulator [Bacillus sp. MUM 13]OIK14625.1 multidrug transporter [Bacillus sp. MUM 13]